MSFIEMPVNPTPEEGISIDMNQMALGEITNVDKDQRETQSVVEYVKSKFDDARVKRKTHEDRWLTCYNNFRGVYGPDTQFTSTEKSQAFIKITKTKVLAAYAQIVDVLFAGNKFPIGIEPAKVPLDSVDKVHFDPAQQQQPQQPQSERFTPETVKIFGPKKKMLEKVKDDLKAGIGQTPTSITFDPAKDAAIKMEKKMHDQLDEAGASKSIRSFVYDQCTFGTGFIKGPFAYDKEYPKWDENGVYTPLIRTIPMIEHVPIWDSYPDPDARNMEECDYFIQRHRLSRSQLRELKKRPMFRGKNIDRAIANGENYMPFDWESHIAEDNDSTTYSRWEVLEFWGSLDAELAKEAGLKIPKKFSDLDQIQVNIWICGDEVLRLVLNPFTPNYIPYHAGPYEHNPYSIFGIGVAENMTDTQLLMNGFMRMAVDNAALSGNVILEVNEDMLVPGQNMELHPGKVFRRQGGQPGQSINSISVGSVTQELVSLFDKARQLSDEATGMPSYAHGMTGVQQTGRTASGMSMLMGAAAQNIKAVVRNIDDYVLTPLGKALFAFNMQFNFDKDFIGDVTVVAKGTESLMRNEIRSQKILQLAQFGGSNQMIAPMLKWDAIIRELTASLELDEEEFVNDPRAAAVQALELQKYQQMLGPQQPTTEMQNAQAQGAGQSPGAPSPADPTQTGGGNIAPGAAPEPGAQGFTGQQAV